MSTRIRFFRTEEQARDTRQYLSAHGIKSYLRDRTSTKLAPGEEAFGFDLFALKDEDVETARQLLDYEFGKNWGE
jgi:hypothetical protein